jgi:exodeoxyribonuclease VII small subunit
LSSITVNYSTGGLSLTSEFIKSTSSTNGIEFEDAYKQLATILEELESGKMTLEQSTVLYEKGITLANKCNEILSSAEIRITTLQTDLGKQMEMLDDLSSEK